MGGRAVPVLLSLLLLLVLLDLLLVTVACVGSRLLAHTLPDEAVKMGRISCTVCPAAQHCQPCWRRSNNHSRITWGAVSFQSVLQAAFSTAGTCGREQTWRIVSMHCTVQGRQGLACCWPCMCPCPDECRVHESTCDTTGHAGAGRHVSSLPQHWHDSRTAHI